MMANNQLNADNPFNCFINIYLTLFYKLPSKLKFIFVGSTKPYNVEAWTLNIQLNLIG